MGERVAMPRHITALWGAHLASIENLCFAVLCRCIVKLDRP